MEVAAKVLAATAVELLTEPTALAAARQSFHDVRDARTFTSLLPPDAKPPARITPLAPRGDAGTPRPLVPRTRDR